MLRAAPLAFLLVAGTAAAQVLPAAGGAPATGTEQRAERITLEDAGSRIDELRVGGQTRSITVQPAGAPAYVVDPGAGGRSLPGDARAGGGTEAGRRSWPVLRF